MNSCNRGYIIGLGNGYNLCALNTGGLAPTPRARSFELADDRVHYAPDRPADVKHVKLAISLDFEQETLNGTVYTTFSALYDDLKTITFDAVELHIERVTLERGQELAFSTEAKKLIAESAVEAHLRLTTCADRWRDQAPKAVATEDA